MKTASLPAPLKAAYHHHVSSMNRVGSRNVSFVALAQFIHHHLLWFLISAYSLSAIWPTAGLWIRNATFGHLQIFHEKLHVSLLLLLLATLMFNAGLGVKTSHFKSLAQKTTVLLAGLTANLAIPMAYIFLVTLVMRLWHNPEESQHILVGLALVAAMPIAGASTAWAQNSNGNLALSLGLVLASTFLSPILTPVALSVFGEMASEEYEQSSITWPPMDQRHFWDCGLWCLPCWVLVCASSRRKPN